MTLKTVTGPTIHDALADARRLFGPSVVLLQSEPGGPGEAASVTVGFDQDTAVHRPPTPRPAPASPAVPEPLEATLPRAYGYASARKPRPASTEAIASPSPTAARPDPSPSPAATATEVAALQARLAELEAALAEVRRAETPAAPAASRRSPLVFVGPAGAGKTSLALRLALSPALTGARRPAVLMVAPEVEHAVDAAPSFWASGVPVAVVASADETAEALAQFADADLILVDTPALSLAPGRARAGVARLGDVLAPLGEAEVHLVVDATRAPGSLTVDGLASLGLRPDGLALTRLDEAPTAADAWAAELPLPIRWMADGAAVSDLANAPAPAFVDPAPAPPAPDPADLPSWVSLPSLAVDAPRAVPAFAHA